jgi:hypothetical protein
MGESITGAAAGGVSEEDFQTALAGKANVSDVNTALAGKANVSVSIPADATDNVTLSLAHTAASLGVDSATGKNVTVPPNTDVAFPVGTAIEIRQVGAGQITIVAGAGVTLRSRANALKIAGQYGAASLLKIATNTWSVQGDLAV